MKIGILSDIHGNHLALKSVLEVARKRAIDKLLVLGDFIGYYYNPDKVLEILANWDFEAIVGNHELILKKIIFGELELTHVTAKYGSGHKVALEKLTQAQLKFLTSNPELKVIRVDDVKIKMCHGAPWDNNFYIYPDSPKSILDKCDDEEIDFVLIGHTHYPFIYKTRNSMLVNVGSVGQSRMQSGIASWAIINTDNSSVEMMATPYDSQELLKEVELRDPTVGYLKDVLIR